VFEHLVLDPALDRARERGLLPAAHRPREAPREVFGVDHAEGVPEDPPGHPRDVAPTRRARATLPAGVEGGRIHPHEGAVHVEETGANHT
jgi:hypothetical protein